MTRPARRSRTRPLLIGFLLLIVALVGLATAGVYSPRIARTVPYLHHALHLLAHQLPASVAWAHDRGTPRLRSGAYFGWSDGREGELHLYGEGCSSNGEQPTYLALQGSGERLEFTGAEVQQLWTDLDRARAHPHMRVSVITDHTLHFDRAVLRCQGGAEAKARISATVQYVPPQELRSPTQADKLLLADPLTPGPPASNEGSEPAAMIYGPSAYPGLGLAGEFTVLTAHQPLSLTAIHYGPQHATTGTVLGAYGHPEALPHWRAQALAENNPDYQQPDLTPLTPWHSGYQQATHPGVLRGRPANQLELALHPKQAGMLFLTPRAFKPTAHPRPLLLRPLLSYEHEGTRGTLVTTGLAFGWTAPP